MQQTFEHILHLRIFLNISTQSAYVYARCKRFYGHIKTHMILCALPCFCIALHCIYFFKTLPMLSNNRHTDKKHALHIHTHTHKQVRLCFNMLKCLFSARTFPDVHAPPCHEEKVGVSIFASPFFGDNDGHFFFSVTDDRQN